MADYLGWLKVVEEEIILALQKIDESSITFLYSFPQMQKDEVEANKGKVENKLKELCENLNKARRQAYTFYKNRSKINKEFRVIDINYDARTLSADLQVIENEANDDRRYIEKALNEFPVVLKHELTANVYTQLGALLKLVLKMIEKLEKA